MYLLSIINHAALQTGALSVITCTTLSGPTCSIEEIKTLAIKWESFNSPKQSSALKNIGFASEDAMILINGLRLVSVHPSEIEYVAACLASCEEVWLRNLFSDLFDIQLDATCIYGNNQSYVKLFSLLNIPR